MDKQNENYINNKRVELRTEQDALLNKHIGYENALDDYAHVLKEHGTYDDFKKALSSLSDAIEHLEEEINKLGDV